MNIVMAMNTVTKSIRDKKTIIINCTGSSISVNKVHALV